MINLKWVIFVIQKFKQENKIPGCFMITMIQEDKSESKEGSQNTKMFWVSLSRTTTGMPVAASRAYASSIISGWVGKWRRRQSTISLLGPIWKNTATNDFPMTVLGKELHGFMTTVHWPTITKKAIQTSSLIKSTSTLRNWSSPETYACTLTTHVKGFLVLASSWTYWISISAGIRFCILLSSWIFFLLRCIYLKEQEIGMELTI